MMSRRNTILTAVLVNAGLLLVLFATATRSGKNAVPNEPVLAEIKASFTSPSKNEIPDQPVNPYLTLPTLADSSQEELIFSPDMTKTFPVEEIPTSPSVLASNAVPASLQPTAPSLEGKLETIVVKKGDMLEKLARAHNTTVSALMKANQLTSTQLKIGQVLKVPGKAVNEASLAKSEKKEEVSDFYIVKEGDNPWLIAKKNQVRLEDLLRLNNLTEETAKKLRPGDRLRIG